MYLLKKIPCDSATGNLESNQTDQVCLDLELKLYLDLESRWNVIYIVYNLLEYP